MIRSHFRIPPSESTQATSATAEGVAVLLAAFPKQVAISIPQPSEIVGRAWLDAAGITDGKTSREHLSFTKIDRRVFVTDKHSHNGTFVNGSRLEPETPTLLDDGAIVRVGQTIFVYRESFTGPLQPEKPLGNVIGPWGLGAVRETLHGRMYRAGLNALVDGAGGTEKADFARELAVRLRPGTKLVEISLGAIALDSFDTTMFGWEQQRFTGNFGALPGLLRSAAGAAVLLHEMDRLPIELQNKLLRFLDKREAQPVGARELLPTVDCLVIATTSRLADELVRDEALSSDVLSRFRLRFELPPLAQRPEDLFAMIAARWTELYGKLDLNATRVDAEAIEKLMLHDWPENVRDLFRLVDSIDRNAGIKHSAVEQLLS